MPDPDFNTALTQAIDQKTKPPGALGRIETLAAQLARCQHRLDPHADTATLTLFAADHGMAAAGVSAYPQAVTRQMVGNFLAGGAAANVFARTLGVGLRVVDAGIAGEPIAHPALIDRRIDAGTANALCGPAMPADAFATAWTHGAALGADSPGEVALFGEMGIGNTASAALVAAKLLGEPVAALTGRGTGLDDAGLARKRALLSDAARRTPARLDAEAALTEYGGFEIVMMAAAMTAAAHAGKLVLVDGFIAGAAALAACRHDATVRPALAFAHRSAEAGHARVLDALDAEPLLDLQLRLGEGTGALLAWPLVQAAAAMLCQMASFADAGVSQSDPATQRPAT